MLHFCQRLSDIMDTVLNPPTTWNVNDTTTAFCVRRNTPLSCHFGQCLFLIQPSLPSAVNFIPGMPSFISQTTELQFVRSLPCEWKKASAPLMPFPWKTLHHHHQMVTMETNIKQRVSSHQLVGQKYIYSESALLLPFCQGSNLKRDLMGNNEKFQC